MKKRKEKKKPEYVVARKNKVGKKIFFSFAMRSFYTPLVLIGLNFNLYLASSLEPEKVRLMKSKGCCLVWVSVSEKEREKREKRSRSRFRKKRGARASGGGRRQQPERPNRSKKKHSPAPGRARP